MRFIRLKEVIHITGLSRSIVYDYMSKGLFPKSVSLGGRSVAWIEEEVSEWVLSRVAERDEEVEVFSRS